MSKDAVSLCEEMLETIQTLMSENETLKRKDIVNCNAILNLKEEVNELKDYLDSVQRVKSNQLSESDLKMIRFLVHPDRSRKNTQDLFCKVNSLLE